MKCPHCNEELKLPHNTIMNVETYGNTVRSITNCCGKLVTVSRIVTFAVDAPEYLQKYDTDEWGRKVEK